MEITTKILDNTTISASISEINSVNIIEKIATAHKLITSRSVFQETCNGFCEAEVDRIYSLIDIVDPIDGDKLKYHELLGYMSLRYPYLHEGELSTFIIAVLNFKKELKNYYYVTDDQKMRKVIEKIKSNEDETFNRIVGLNLSDFNYTGTLGLLKRMVEKSIISNEEIKLIANDLKSSGFRISEKILSNLLGGIDD
jgi:predicted nucleic acid-binding protein